MDRVEWAQQGTSEAPQQTQLQRRARLLLAARGLLCPKKANTRPRCHAGLPYRAQQPHRRPACPLSLDFIDHPRRGVSVRESPDLHISRKHTRGPLAQLSLPDQGPYLTFCTIASSEITNNKSIEWLQRVGGMITIPTYLYLGTLGLLHFASASCLQPVAGIIVFSTLCPSLSMGWWCGTKPQESSLYLNLTTCHRYKHHFQ